MGRPPGIANGDILAVARRVLLARGAGVSVAEIARELGVSHTTLFNRFGSKEALMIAALGALDGVTWAEDLENGPDQRPIVEQLLGHGRIVSAHLQQLHEGLAVLQAAGISPQLVCADQSVDSGPVKAFKALVRWLDRAQQQGRLAKCDTEALASTILGALYNSTVTSAVCGQPTGKHDRERYVDNFIHILWRGIDPQL
ncbi:TetR/AcrR family transcriptional regulator [uncultured Devosia sp.]|uniref:TetR/AcrR family transcriptional regulator n=1 Tax=uncultured Devosia sp. TaxID=211434 RepID=UPI0035C9BCCF